MGEWVVGGWLEGSLGGWVCSGVGGGGVHGGVDGWRVHVVGAYTHPPIKSYNVKIFNFMNTHPPTHQTYPKCHSFTIHILWRVHGVGGDGGGVGGCRVHGVGGWFEGSWGGCVCGYVSGGGVGGWRVHGWVVGLRVHGMVVCVVMWVVVWGWMVGGFMGWVVGKFMEWVGVWWCGWLWGAWWGDGWGIHGVGAYTHPYNVKTFHFISTHPPIKHIQSVTLLLYIYSPTHEQL